MSAADAPGLIYDTDICGDCDDVLALGMIHALQSRGACNLLAVTVSVGNDLAAPFVDVVNTFYGRGDIPIGVVGKGGVVEQSKYLGLVEEKDSGGRFRYPHALLSGKDASPATRVLRQALAAQPDGSVVIAQDGFSTNLARLLDSGPDEHSPLTGVGLAKRKVKLRSLKAGAFQPIDGNEKFQEFNVMRDVPSCRKLAVRWPNPMAWSGFEIGIALPYPATSIERDYGYVPHHPVAEAYIGPRIEWIARPLAGLGISTAFLIALVLVLLGHVLLTRTTLGRYMIAVGTNEEAVRLSGIDPRPVKLITFVLSGLLAGLGVLFQVARVSSADPNGANGMELGAIAAVVIGGTSLMGGRGSVLRTFLGVLIIATLQTGLAQVGASEPAKRLITGAVIVLAVIADVHRETRVKMSSRALQKVKGRSTG